MKFKSKNEAYTYAILILYQLKAEKIGTKHPHLLSCIDNNIQKLKIAVENHEQDLKIVIALLKQIEYLLEHPETRAGLAQLSNDILMGHYDQTAQTKFENPLARRAESELALVLLKKPTLAMMEAVDRVSVELLKVIDDMEITGSFEQFRSKFASDADAIAFGAPMNMPEISDIKNILRDNNPAQLIEIMHIHFKFSHHIIRKVSIRHAPAREPVGKLASIVETIYPGKAIDFFAHGITDNWYNVDSPWSGKRYRQYICNEVIYGASLFTTLPHRGRKGHIDSIRTHQMGLMLRGQEEHEAGLPSHYSSWVADCKSQPADFSSQHVIDLIDNDTVYVSGPSGMVSLLLGQMETIANLEHEYHKKNYLSAVLSYIVGAGFHSIHEVIGPAAFSLGLVPGYNIQPPKSGELAPAPNYYQFFSQQAGIDAEFASRRDEAWMNYLKYFNEIYAPKYLAGFISSNLNFKKHIEVPEKLRTAITLEMASYIRSRYNQKHEVNFISKFFRNSTLMKDKLRIAIDVQGRVGTNTALDLTYLKQLIIYANYRNKRAETNAKKNYGLLSQGSLNCHLHRITLLVENYDPDQQKQASATTSPPRIS